MATGTPCSSAKAITSSASATGFFVPGAMGASAASAMWRAVTLSPSAAMDSGDGPIHVMSASMTFCANSAFSERKP